MKGLRYVGKMDGFVRRIISTLSATPFNWYPLTIDVRPVNEYGGGGFNEF